MKASNPPLPQRAFVDTLSVDEDTAFEEERVEVDGMRADVDEMRDEVEGVRVKVELGFVLDVMLDETGTEDEAGYTVHVPKFALHPIPQYALVFPQ